MYLTAALAGWAGFIGILLWLWHRNSVLAAWHDRVDADAPAVPWNLQ